MRDSDLPIVRGSKTAKIVAAVADAVVNLGLVAKALWKLGTDIRAAVLTGAPGTIVTTGGVTAPNRRLPSSWACSGSAHALLKPRATRRSLALQVLMT